MWSKTEVWTHIASLHVEIAFWGNNLAPLEANFGMYSKIQEDVLLLQCPRFADWNSAIIPPDSEKNKQFINWALLK